MNNILNYITLVINICTLILLIKTAINFIHINKDISLLFYIVDEMLNINKDLIENQDKMGDAIKYIHKNIKK